MDITDLINEFGGTAEMARLCGIKPPAVSNWKASGKLPERHHYRLCVEAKRRGIAIDERIFSGDAKTVARRKEGE